jgi:hypothetical protein
MSPTKPQPKPPEPKYSWTRTGNKVTCSKNSAGGQTVLKLWEASELSSFHDAELAKATKEINAILAEVEKGNTDRNRTPSFIRFQNRHFMIWSTYDVVGPEDDEATIIKALKLKTR